MFVGRAENRVREKRLVPLRIDLSPPELRLRINYGNKISQQSSHHYWCYFRSR